jgi:hypothetical protein
VTIEIDPTRPGDEVSPLIRGVSGGLTVEQLGEAGIRLVSWGGNPSTRYNYLLGHAWNTAADAEFRNVNYRDGAGDAYLRFEADSASAGAATRLVVPTLGWVAKDDDPSTCSFPDGKGGCLPASEVGDCADPKATTDPQTTSVRSTPEMVADWIDRLLAEGAAPDYIAFDNEPELWGYTHFDVHPECTTFEEVLDHYLSYSRAIRRVAPEVQLLGPVTCCWFDYWDPDVKPEDGSDLDFLSWFLQRVAAADEDFGQRTLDLVDVHYYPQSDVFNDLTDAETNARRLRSTRSLWDPDYVDESWIHQRITFIPRMREIIEREYPGTPLAISEWNFGADHSINGALAIADVLGIYGREGVQLAAYFFAPAVDSPGYLAFKMHGNYDGQGTPFEGDVVPTESSHVDVVSAYSVLDKDSGQLRVMLINKNPDVDITAELRLDGFVPRAEVRRFTYGATNPDAIVSDSLKWRGSVVVPAYSIVVLELTPGGGSATSPAPLITPASLAT